MKYTLPILSLFIIFTSCTKAVRRDVIDIKQKQERLTVEPLPLLSDDQKIDGNAFHYYTNGNLFELMGNAYKAVESYRKALAYYPDSYEIKYSIAINLNRLQDFRGVLDALAGIEPEDLPVLSLRGNIYRSMGFADSARTTFFKAAMLDPDNAAVFSYLAGQYRVLGKVDSTAWAYENLLRIQPDNYRIWYELGIVRLRQGDFEKAKNCFSSSIALQPDSVNIISYIGLGDIYQEQNHLDSALSIYKLALDISDDNVLIHRGMASTYALMDSLDQALVHSIQEAKLAPFERTSARRLGMMYYFMDSLSLADSVFTAQIESGDQNPLTHKYLGRIALRNEDYDKGLHHFNLLTQFEDSVAENWLDLGFLYRLLKQPDNEILTYQTALEHMRDPSQYDAILFALAVSYERFGPFEKSIEAFEELIERNSQHDQALNYLGYSLADRGVRLNYALELLTRAISIQPNNPAYLDSYGWIYFRLENYNEAVKYLEQAAMLDNDPVIFDHLGDAYYATGKRDEARQWWNRALELSPENQEIKEKLDH